MKPTDDEYELDDNEVDYKARFDHQLEFGTNAMTAALLAAVPSPGVQPEWLPTGEFVRWLTGCTASQLKQYQQSVQFRIGIYE